jgi:elongation factor Ts
LKELTMAEITAALVKELREISGAGMMDCKKALQETNGDVEAAVDWLRTKGLSKAAKKAGRAAAEGLIAGLVSNHGRKGVLIELNAETDFVAKNERFQQAARHIAATALELQLLHEIHDAPVDGGEKVGDMITGMIATIGENMQLRRTAKVEVDQGAVALYLHNKQGEGVARLGVLVGLEGSGDQAKLAEVARNIALHVAGTPTPPLALTSDELDPTVVAKEREIQTQMAMESGKPREIAEKMVEGRIRKWQEEVVLQKQPFVMNPDQTIEQLVAQTAKDVGSPVTLKGFVRFALGEGVDKGPEGPDLATEVAQMAAART